jgi:hypothetical protein
MSATSRVNVLSVMFLAVAVTVAAQEQRGRIIGVVTDETSAVLPGVTVTATSPSLIKPQVTTTSEDGSYRLQALPTGEYTLVFELSGFQTLRREGIRVALNVTVTIDAQITISSLQETVTITGESPMVDSKSTGVVTSFQKELLTEIPNARDLFATIAQAPGFQMGGYDVGGSHAATQTAFVTYGVSSQNTSRIEGINVTENTGGTNLYTDYGAIDEYQAAGSGNMGDQGGPGALLSIMIKSGGDQFKGSAYGDFQNSDTIGDNVPAAFRAPGGLDDDGFRAPTLVDPLTGALKGLETGNPITKQYDLNASLGGPIKRGRAWFFGGLRNNQQFKRVLGVPVEAETTVHNYTAKVTYQLTANNQLIGFYAHRFKLQPLRDISLVRPAESAVYQSGYSDPSKIEWTSVLSPRLFLDVQAAHVWMPFPQYPTQTQSESTEGVPVGRIDLATNQASGAWSSYSNRIITKPQVSASLSLFQEGWAGTHDFKFSFEGYRERGRVLRIQPGDIYYRDRAGVPVEVDIYNTPLEPMNDSTLLDASVRDSWAVSRRLTFNLGMRWESHRQGWPAQSATPNQSVFFDPISTPATHVVTFNSVSPRLGFALDLTGKGKTVWKAFYGRFYMNPSYGFHQGENPVSQATRRYRFTDLNGNKVLDAQGELGAFISSTGGGGLVRVDRSIENSYGDEVSTHVEQELATNVSLRATYVYKNMRHQWEEVDLNRGSVTTVPFITTDPVTGERITLLDRPGDVPENRVITNPERYGFPEASGAYHTVEMALNRRFYGNWLLLTSFQHTWSHDWRETTSTTNALNAAGQATGYSWDPNVQRLGKQDTTSWNYKLVGRYDLPWGIGTSASYKLQSGNNWARTLNLNLPVAGAVSILAEPLANNRAPNVHIFDIRLDKDLQIGKGKLTGMLDVFNVLNANPVTNFRVISGSRFKEVISILDPRVVRFGVRYEF